MSRILEMSNKNLKIKRNYHNLMKFIINILKMIKKENKNQKPKKFKYLNLKILKI